MTINWKNLEDGTASLTTLTKTGQNQVEFVYYSGLKASLSTLNGYFPPSGGGAGLSVYVDTLVVDARNFDVAGINIIARNVDVSMLSNQGKMSPMVLLPSTQCFVVAGQTSGGAWQFTTQAQPTAIQTVPLGVETLKPFLLSVTNEGKLSGSQMTPAEALPNSLGRPAALNSLKASFIAASILMESAGAENRTTARAMLQWVVACCETIVALGKAAPAPVEEPSFDQLRMQAAALLVTINVRDGVYYAPPLAPDYYKDKITGLIGTLATYEGQIQTLATQTDIKQAIADVSGTLQKNAAAVAGAYQAQLDGIDANLKTLLAGINTLQGQYLSQASTAEAAWVKLEAAMAKADITAFLKAVLDTAMSAAKVALAANPEAPDVGAIADGIVAGIGTGLTALELAAKDAPTDGQELLSAATDLLHQQNEMTISAWASYQLWLAARGETSVQVPLAAGVMAVDPRIAWQNYIDAAEAQLTNIKDAYSDTPAAAEAVNYLASLKALTQFGMGIGANLVAYTAQLADGVALTARLNANKAIEAEWKSLQEKSASEEDQLLALKGLVTTQAAAIQRSIYAAYRLYVSAFFYSNLKPPPEFVTVSMTSAQLTEAFNGISSWTAAAADQQVTLPVEDATLSLEFPIVKAGDAVVAGAGDINPVNAAFLTPARGSTPASLIFGFPISSSVELATILGHQGKVAIWIKEAGVVINGATPNAKKNIILTLSTSGAYVNGFGPQKAYGFVNGGVSGEYAYNADTGKGYIPWKLPPLVYSKPTPYTTWKIEMDASGGDITSATSVSLNLTVAVMTTPPV